MCGITGRINLNGSPVEQSVLDRATDALAHRGPDGRGTFIDANAGLGHRRLSIIDLSDAAAQPMLAENGRYAITYNGELYNFKELRAELEEAGHAFNSSSDTEVVLRAFVHWGPGCLARFNGMFAFAVWDRAEHTLFMARDRYGIKPLYYAHTGTAFLFGSEQKAILEHPDCHRELDLEALVEYFTFQNIFTDRTLIKAIKTLPAGHHATLKTDGELVIRRYWDYDFREPDTFLDEAEYLEELDFLFRQAVTRQLVSDTPVGSYLSGGIDSGSVTCVAAGNIPGMPTFTCGFDMHSASGMELAFDERERAEHMSYLFGTEHYEVVLKAGDMERAMRAIAHHIEEPRVGQSYPNYYVARLASRFVKVALAGTGGDEMFGGYPWRYFRGCHGTSIDEYASAYYEFWQRLIPNGGLEKVFAPVWKEVRHVDTRAIFQSVFPENQSFANRPEDYINKSLYFEAKTFLHGLLTVEDKLSMAHGLEVRVPFLDNDLVDFAMRLPVSMKLKLPTGADRLDENEPGPKGDKYFLRTGDGKLLLRKALTPFVSKAVSEAPKQGFSGPDASWFRGESMQYVSQRLIRSRPALYDYLDADTVRHMVMEHLEGKTNRRLLIWSLLNVDEWLGATLGGRHA